MAVNAARHIAYSWCRVCEIEVRPEAGLSIEDYEPGRVVYMIADGVEYAPISES